MNKKRTHSEAALVHPSRQHQVPGDHSRHVKKPRPISPGPKYKQAHAPSINTIKKNVRSVTRLLEKSEDLPANVRIDEERRLAAMQADIVAAETMKFKQKMIKRYHMVRFFERQKATRHLKKQRKQLLAAQTPEDIEAATTRVHIAEVDLNYAQYCPLSEPYISLYVREAKNENGEEPESTNHYNVASKPLVWAEVERSMTDGTLDILRNRVTTKISFRPKPKAVQPKSSLNLKLNESAAKQSSSSLLTNERLSESGNRHKRDRGENDSLMKGVALDNPEDQIDGGFFEE